MRRTRRRRDPASLSGVGRLEAFTDGVFAIAITLLVLDLRAPDDLSDLGSRLRSLWPSYLSYVISFLLIGLIWANHQTMFERVRHVDRTLTFLNVVLLMFVAALPFPTALMARSFAQSSGTRLAVFLYGMTLAVGGVFFNLVWWWPSRRPELRRPGIADDEVRRLGRWFVLGPIAYAAAALVGLALPALGVVAYAALIVRYWLAPPTRPAGAPHRREPATVVRELFARMQERDWEGAAALVAADAPITWPATGERFVGRSFVAMNAAYPEGWTITVDDVVADGSAVSALVTVAHPPDVHRCAGTYRVVDGRIVAGTELWVTEGAEPAPEWRRECRT